MLEGIYFYNYTTPEFNVYITELPFWTLTVYYAYKSITGDKLKDWFLLGVCGAIGLLSHYLFSYILLSITIFFIYIFFQDKKFNFKSLIALEVFLILMIPHGLWLIENEFITITYGMHRSGSGLENLTFINHLVKICYKVSIFL